MKVFREKTGIKYSKVAVITNRNICDNRGGWTFDFGGTTQVVLAESDDPGTMTHELGHQFALREEYCSCDTVYKDGLDMGIFCGSYAPYNPLRADLGCDVNGDCCFSADLPEPYTGCKACKGNIDRLSGGELIKERSAMSGGRSFWKGIIFGQRDHYSQNAYEHLQTQRLMECGSGGGGSWSQSWLQSKSLSVESNVSNATNSTLEIKLRVYKNNTVVPSNISIDFGEKLDHDDENGTYSLRILDGNETTIYTRNFSLSFFILSDPIMLTNVTIFYDRIPFIPSMKKIKLYYNGSPIFSLNVGTVCNYNAICEPRRNESYYSCPNDCLPYANDSICNNNFDGGCDPDCLKGYDPDCKLAKITKKVFDYGLDNNSDGLFDYLVAKIEINVSEPGSYGIRAGLASSDMQIITESSTALFNLSAGLHNVSVMFSGYDIFNSRKNGSYWLKYVRLFDENNKTIDFGYLINQTSWYNYTQFQKQASFSGYYIDNVIDVSGDGFYDYLNVNAGVIASKAGIFKIYGELRDKNNIYIDGVYVYANLSAGSHIVSFNFSGLRINANGKDGPYNLYYVKLSNYTNGFIFDSKYNVYNTSNYNYLNFAGATIAGFVTGVNSTGVSDSEIVLQGPRSYYTYTDINGSYRIGGLFNGTYDIFVRSPYDSEFADVNSTIDLQYGTVTSFNITLQKGGIIEGTVLDYDGYPISYVDVYAEGPSYRYGETDENGEYILRGL
ncbi:MAG: carboxypeptidase regulatory-like domain-containing protein, partial [Candidatus Aenigmarchaeota archaeon]|nr:carboxypeptidase regulatory-like domain-containing protein [Candidatus Aenigmarchaeota archaeon]